MDRENDEAKKPATNKPKENPKQIKPKQNNPQKNNNNKPNTQLWDLLSCCGLFMNAWEMDFNFSEYSQARQWSSTGGHRSKIALADATIIGVFHASLIYFLLCAVSY